MPNLPYEAPKDCEDAQTFLLRMQQVDEQVARLLNEAHEKHARTENLKRSERSRSISEKSMGLVPETRALR